MVRDFIFWFAIISNLVITWQCSNMQLQGKWVVTGVMVLALWADYYYSK